MTVYTVYISFIILILFLLIIGIYFIISIILEKTNVIIIENKKDIALKYFITINKSNTSDNGKYIIKLKENFSTRTGIQSFYLAYKSYIDKYGHDEKIDKIVNEVVDYKKILKSKIVRKHFKRNYTLYLLSEFKIYKKEVIEFAIDSLEHKSIYVRNNALNIIKFSKDIQILLRTLEKINNKKTYFNEKIIIDFMDSFEGNRKKLDNKLLLKFSHYNIFLKKVIIQHFINVGYDDLEIKNYMLELLSNSKEKEIIINTIKYFSNIKDKRAEKYILENMDSEDWTIRAISAKAISNYKSKDTIEKLRKSLGDKNYFVRFNSAHSFLLLEDSRNVLRESLNNKDKFARDILLYCMNTKGIISLEKYNLLLKQSKSDVKDDFLEKELNTI